MPGIIRRLVMNDLPDSVYPTKSESGRSCQRPAKVSRPEALLMP